MPNNKHKQAFGLSLLLLFLSVDTEASMVKLKMRCSEDSLDPSQATERVEWATKCHHISADDRNDALYTGEGKRKRSQPMYPIFATADLASLWRAPVDRNAPCTVPPGQTIMGFCTSSCYTPDQELLFPEGFVSIKKARDQFLSEVVTLDKESSIQNLKLKSSNVAAYTEEIRNTWHNILVFKTSSGGSLKVTPNHPLVDSNGVVRTADSFKVGDSLIHFEQGLDAIVSIKPLRYFGKVYNINPATEDLSSNIVIAQGYLNGSAYYQNDGSSFLNQSILRKTIPGELLQ